MDSHYKALGEASPKKDYGNGLQFAKGWDGDQKYWVYLENFGDQQRIATLIITFQTFKNFKITHGKFKDDEIHLCAQPNSFAFGILEKIEPTENASIKKWAFAFKYEVLKEDINQIEKDLIKAGSEKEAKTNYKDGLKFASGWFNDKCFVYLENFNKFGRTSELTINLVDLENLKVGNLNKLDDKNIRLICAPGERKVGYTQKIDQSQKGQIKSWKFSFQHTQKQEEEKKQKDHVQEKQQKKSATDEHMDQQNKLMEDALKNRRDPIRSEEQDALVRSIDVDQVSNMTTVDQQWLEINEQVKENYVDLEFAHSKESLSKTDDAFQNKFNGKEIWMRPHEFMNVKQNQIKLFDNIDCNDVQQGSLGVCYLLSNLSGLAEYPERIVRIFNSRKINHKGVYSVTLFHKGCPKEIIIDDYFPCYKRVNRGDPLFCKPCGQEIWVMVLEKAWAKLFGDYHVAEGMHIDESMNILLGVPTIKVAMSNFTNDSFYTKVKQWDEQKCMMGLCSNSNVSRDTGLVGPHAYTLISAHKVAGHPELFKLRNPWGHFEFKIGQYSDNSQIWKEDLKLAEALNFKSRDDGIFFMTAEEIHKYFVNISVAFYNEDYELETFFTKDSDKQEYQVEVTEPSQLAVYLTQEHSKIGLQNQSDFKYGTSHIMMFQGKDKLRDSWDDFKQLQMSYFVHTLSKDGYVNLQPGTYVMKCQCTTQLGWGTSFYGTRSISIKKIKK